MPAIRAPLSKFLASSRNRLIAAAASSHPTSLVIGNESADIDSFTSSLLYAYLSPTPTPPIPALMISRQDLSLRPDLIHVLSLVSLSPPDLIFKNDKPEFSSLDASNTSLHLVDHNNGAYPNTVEGIIDHHADEGFFLTANPRIIKTAGSCTSLITTHFKENFPKEPEAIKHSVAKLALAAVLIDTTNMTQKVTPHDEEAVRFLVSQLSGEPSWDRKSFYEGIQKAKNNIDGLSTRDLLRKDYKEWIETAAVSGRNRKLGISSVLRGFSGIMQKSGSKAEFLDILKKWGTERGLDVVCVMTADASSGRFKREVLVWALDGEGVECVEGFEKGGKLELTEWRGKNGEVLDGDDGKRRVWKLVDVSNSRKQVAPYLRKCLKMESGGGSSKV